MSVDIISFCIGLTYPVSRVPSEIFEKIMSNDDQGSDSILGQMLLGDVLIHFLTIGWKCSHMGRGSGAVFCR